MISNDSISKKSVRNVQDAGKVCVLDIEVEGVKQIRDSELNPLLVFVLPPSIDELKRRLIERKTETPESLQKRLDTAHREIEYSRFGSSSSLFFSLEKRKRVIEMGKKIDKKDRKTHFGSI